ASDSLFVGTNLDGGSLIEAALDDFILYDKLIIGVEDQQRVDAGFFVFPNPSHGQASVRNVNEQSFTGSVEVVDALGRVVWSAANQTIAAGGVMRLDLSTLADGHYMIRLMNQGTQASYPLQLRK
ncbi:MAG: T9SS type A sorting domain-containing protein, partial [Flavobacteriales bacterium]